MRSVILYNEIDPYPAAWLRNLIAAGHLPAGEVDERSIADLDPADCPATAHFFAGIGGWPYALRLAGVPDDAPVWTGSCPCQPFSVAGKRKGHEDERHLWPAWFRLIRERRPPTIFGEQVASRDGIAWFDAVRADLEMEGYAVAAADLCAAGVGAFHIRQRVYFVAYAEGGYRGLPVCERGSCQEGVESGRSSKASLVAYSERGAAERQRHDMAGSPQGVEGEARERERIRTDARPSGNVEWIPCRDGKLRPVEPGTFPLAHGIPARVGRLRAYGNAIVPQVAAEFVKASMEALRDRAGIGYGGG